MLPCYSDDWGIYVTAATTWTRELRGVAVRIKKRAGGWGVSGQRKWADEALRQRQGFHDHALQDGQ